MEDPYKLKMLSAQKSTSAPKYRASIHYGRSDVLPSSKYDSAYFKFLYRKYRGVLFVAKIDEKRVIVSYR